MVVSIEFSGYLIQEVLDFVSNSLRWSFRACGRVRRVSREGGCSGGGSFFILDSSERVDLCQVRVERLPLFLI